MAIQQHPIPQDISNYKFRLIGDMTIKQFASLGISIVLSVVIYSAPIPFFFKYPLSFIFLVLGVGMAFVPVQGRTLDIWIIAFIKSIYSPTQFIWKHGQEATTTTSATPATESQTPNTPVVNVSPPIPEENLLPETETLSQPPTTEEISVSPPISIVNPPTETPTNSSVPEQSISPTLPPEPIAVDPIPQAPEPKQEVVSQPPPSPVDPSSLPIPFTPSNPNTLVGLTLNPEGQILDGVLVEIKQQDLTLRATKSNKLGQFLFVRPLENGLYQILAEKEDFKFDIYSIELMGEIIKPLKIQALK